METAGRSLTPNEFEARAEEQVEKLVSDIGRVIRNADPLRRSGLKELAETLLHEEILTIVEEQTQAPGVEEPRKRANPLAGGLLLALLGLGLAIVVPFVGLTLAAIGFLLVLWGAAMSWLRK